jgi:hypothetical protein
VRFLALNSQYFEDASKVPELAQKHEEWLNEELRLAKQAGSRVIVFQHIPWFLNDPDEETNYFSIKPNIRKVWLEKFKNSGKKTHCLNICYLILTVYRMIRLETSGKNVHEMLVGIYSTTLFW